MEHAETRTELLIGTDGIRRLKESCVCVLGIGGVGSYCAEALARSGVGRLILVDGDTVAESNLNRADHGRTGDSRAGQDTGDERSDPAIPRGHRSGMSAAVLQCRSQ